MTPKRNAVPSKRGEGHLPEEAPKQIKHNNHEFKIRSPFPSYMTYSYTSAAETRTTQRQDIATLRTI